MRSAQKSNRSRGRGNRKPGGNNVNRVYDSAGPEGKVRGTPQQIIDKYLTLARDAQTSGDRVTAENFLQHAEHYQRLLIQAMGAQEQARKDQEASDEVDEQPEIQDQPAAAADDAEEQPAQPPRKQNGRRRRQPQRPEIGGMTTIDAEEPAEADNLLVADEQPAEQKPAKANGANQPQQPLPVDAGAPDTADDAQPEA